MARLGVDREHQMNRQTTSFPFLLLLLVVLVACGEHSPRYGWTPSPFGVATPGRRIAWQLSCNTGITTYIDGAGSKIDCGHTWRVNVRNDGRIAAILLSEVTRPGLMALVERVLPNLTDAASVLTPTIDESYSSRKIAIDGIDVSVRNVNTPLTARFEVQWIASINELSDE